MGRSRTASRIRSPASSRTSVAAGSPPTNEYRPQRSERSTDSSRMPGPSPATAGNRPTGVDTSASSSAHTGTSAHSRARAVEPLPIRVDRQPRCARTVAVLFQGRLRSCHEGAPGSPGLVASGVRRRSARRRPGAHRARRPRPALPRRRHRGWMVPSRFVPSQRPVTFGGSRGGRAPHRVIGGCLDASSSHLGAHGSRRAARDARPRAVRDRRSIVPPRSMSRGSESQRPGGPRSAAVPRLVRAGSDLREGPEASSGRVSGPSGRVLAPTVLPPHVRRRARPRDRLARGSDRRARGHPPSRGGERPHGVLRSGGARAGSAQAPPIARSGSPDGGRRLRPQGGLRPRTDSTSSWRSRPRAAPRASFPSW